MQVLLQDVVVNSSNIRHVLQRLHSEFTLFSDRLAEFLKDIKRKRSTMNYVLDVGHSTTGVGIAGDPEPAKSSASGKGISMANTSNKPLKLAKTTGGPNLTTRRKSDTNSLTKSMSNPAASLVLQPTNLPANTMSSSTGTAASAKKDIWGIGQTGSNLSYHLHAGLLSLSLLPQDARPTLVFITDGVVKSNIQDEEVVRLFAKDDIPCTIIQIGSGQGFTPADNFGFVPDNEILRFLAAATGGKFMYSSDCKMLTDPVTKSAAVPPMKFTQQTLSSNLLDTSAAASPINTPTVELFPSLASALASSSRSQPSTPFLPLYPPNFYHKHFLIRETSYFRQRPDTRYSSMGTASIGLADPPVDVPRERYARSGAGRGGVFGIDNVHLSIHDPSFGSPLNFPWDPKSQSPAVETKVVRYREYGLCSEISHVIAARLRQGFSIHSVAISENSNVREVGISGKPVEKIRISMILLWLPNVTIEYNIKALWLPIGTTSATGTGNSANNIFLRTKTPRAEVYVGAHTSFAHLFVDVGHKSTSAPGNDSTYPVFAKVHKLHQFLSRIYETDELLKSWTNFNTKFTMTVRQQLSGRNYSSSSASSSATLASGQQSSQHSPANQTEKYIETFTNHWEVLERNDHRPSTKCWYDFAEIDFLVGHVSPYMSSDYNEQYVNSTEIEIKEAIGIVEEQITRTWATFMSKNKVFVRILLKSNNVNSSGSSTPLTSGSGDTIYSVDRTYLNSHVPSFCELRLSRDTGYLVTARLLFFNVDIHTRRKTVDDLALKLSRVEWNRERFVATASGTNGRSTPISNTHRKWLIVCQRPLSHLLMRDTEHYISSDDPEIRSPSSMSIIDSGQKHQLHQQPQHSSAAIGPNTWYTSSTLCLKSEYIVKNYLRHSSCSWLTEGEEDLYYQDAKIISIQDLAFQFLCQARLDQRYLLVATQQNKNHFYQELFLDSDVPVLATAVQYFIWKDPTGKISTELWMEPAKDRDLRDHFETIKSQTYNADRKTISQLVTFDKIHAIGRNHTKPILQSGSTASSIGHHHSKGSISGNDAGTKLPTTFDVVSVLRLGKFLIAAYALPVYGIGERSPLDRLANLTVETMLDKSPLSWGAGDNLSSPLSEAATSDPGSLQMGEAQHVGGGGGGNHSRQTTLTDTPQGRQNYRGHTLQLQKSSPMGSPATDASSIASIPVASDSIYALKPDDLLNQHKGSLSKLEYAKRDCALMHFFVEKSLTKLMDGEIPMAQHEPREKFWDEMKKAMVSTDNEYNIFTSHHFVRNLRDTRCFVKIFDPRSFMLILAPSLGIVVDGLDKNISAPLPPQLASDEFTSKSSTVKYMSFLMFECVRQKPLRPVKRSAYSRFPSTESIIEGSELFEPDQVTFKPMPFLVEESDGLGTTLRPTLFDGQYHTTQGLTKLSERTLRLTQDISKLYARSFVKSIYSSLLQSHVVDASDFDKVMDICAEASMEIDITGYLNVQTLLKKKGPQR